MDPRIDTQGLPTPATRMPGWPRTPRALGAGRGAAWWSEGWRVFTAAPLMWIGLLVVLVIIMFALQFVPVIGQIAVALLWPVWFGGLMLGCHALAQGKPLEFSHLFAGFTEGRTMPLVILGLISFLASFAMFAIITFIALGSFGFAGLWAMLSGDPTTMMNAMGAGLGGATLFAALVGLVLGILYLMAWWFAPALVALNRADPVSAFIASFSASARNFGAIIVAFLILLVLALVASIPFGLGWIVLAPVAVGAVYASWREVFGE